MAPRRSRPAPLWFHVCVAVALAAVLRGYLELHGTGAAGPGALPPPSAAFLGFLILIGQLIWKGLEVAGKITLQVVHWMVINLSLLVTKISNGLGALGHSLLQGLKRTWDFFKLAYTDVVKPAVQKLWSWYKRFVHWLDETVRPILDHLKILRDNLVGFWKTWVRPWLDLIDVTRKALRVLAGLGLGWAKALDAKLGALETAIERPFRLVLAKLNEVINIVNRVITLDGLVQRVALVRSLERDYVFAWRALVNPWRKALSESDQQRTRDAVDGKEKAAVAADLRAYLSTRGGSNAAIVSEMAQQWRIYLRS